MARSKRGRSKPVSEKDAGETVEASDDVAELLDSAATPEGEPAPAEAVASGPQPMPGSASDRETRVEPPKKAKKTKKDLRNLAPKKAAPTKGRHPGMSTKPGASALQQVLARGIDKGDTTTVAPVEMHRVTKGGKAMISGRLCQIKEGARITRLTHDLENLRLQGIQLTLISRG
jgi:hypothetical protein